MSPDGFDVTPNDIEAAVPGRSTCGENVRRESNQEGRIDIDWQANGTLRLTWTESGGPPVEPPTGRGFGSRLIERGLRHEIGGRVALGFAPEGVICTIEVPLDGLEPLDRF